MWPIFDNGIHILLFFGSLQILSFGFTSSGQYYSEMCGNLLFCITFIYCSYFLLADQ